MDSLSKKIGLFASGHTVHINLCEPMPKRMSKEDKKWADFIRNEIHLFVEEKINKRNKRMNNICLNIKKIKGVRDCFYNINNLSLAIYYSKNSDLDYIKIMACKYVSDRMLNNSVETYNFYSME